MACTKAHQWHTGMYENDGYIDLTCDGKDTHPISILVPLYEGQAYDVFLVKEDWGKDGSKHEVATLEAAKAMIAEFHGFDPKDAIQETPANY